MHALEHYLAYNIRNELDGVIDVSPMGCRTGFYLTTWGNKESIEIKEAVEVVLKNLLKAEDIPASNEVQCGNYKDLSLFGAKEYAKDVIRKGFSLNVYGK